MTDQNPQTTPEPVAWIDGSDLGHIGAGYPLTTTLYCTNGKEPEDAANARLIAAAPEMLEALKAFVRGCDHLTTPELELARAAIIRADGGGA